MAGLAGFLQNVRRVVGLQKAGDWPDALLLQQFIADRDEVAFETLLRRHGPMVLGVCRRVLQEEHDAEDAFQATFLVLLRKAHAIGKPELLGNWLFGVAYRIAMRSRSAAVKRRRVERRAVDMHSNNANPQGRPVACAPGWQRVNEPQLEVVGSDLSPMLEEEVNRLPKKYRAPVVLCYLEGKTNEEASRELGWPLGTVAGRLARARDMLRNRLNRRGSACSAGVFATALSQKAAPAALPASLVASTVKAATLIAAGHAAAGAFSASVAALAEGAIHSMFLTKLKITGFVLIAVSLVGVGGGMLTRQALADKDQSIKEDEPKTGPKAVPTANKDQEKLQGTWKVVLMERDGQEVTEEEAKNVKIVFAGDKVTFHVGGSKIVGTYKLDPSSKPKRIELTRNEGPEQDRVKLAIYDLSNSILQLCANNTPGGEVPTEFATKSQSGQELIVLKRVRPEDVEKEADVQAKAGEKSASASARARSENNLKQIGLAMHNYHDTYAHFPAAAIYSKDGKPLLSWRVMILPYIEQDALYKEFKLDEPWDSEHNKKLLDRMPTTYAPLAGKTKDKHSTFYQVFVGKGTIFERKVGLRFVDIPDGTSNTIFAVEAGEAVPWTKPQDLPFDRDKALPPLGGMFKGGFNVLMADGSVRFFKEKFDERKMKLLIIRDDGENVKVDDLTK